MTYNELRRRLRELDGLIEKEKYACEADPRMSRETMNRHKAERQRLEKDLADFLDDPMTQACGIF